MTKTALTPVQAAIYTILSKGSKDSMASLINAISPLLNWGNYALDDECIEEVSRAIYSIRKKYRKGRIDWTIKRVGNHKGKRYCIQERNDEDVKAVTNGEASILRQAVTQISHDIKVGYDRADKESSRAKQRSIEQKCYKLEIAVKAMGEAHAELMQELADMELQDAQSQ